jgi:hypothetical protein
MSKSDPNHPAFPVYQKLEKHIQQIKNLLNELDHSERLTFTNEIFVRLLMDRNQKTISAQDKIKARILSNKSTVLTAEQERLINKLTRATENLYRESQDDFN